MSALGFFLLLQYLSAALAPSPWLTPDFVVLGMVFAVARSPKRWVLYCALTAGFALLWAVRSFVLLAASSLALGASIAWAAGRWDFSDRRALLSAVGLAVAAVNGLMIWSEDIWSWAMLFFLAVRLGLTLLCAFCIYPFWKKPAAAARYG